MGKHDSLLDSIFMVADRQCTKVWHYEADFYYKEFTDLKKKNISIRICDNSDYYLNGGKTLFSEEAGTMEHTYDMHYAYKTLYHFNAVQGTTSSLEYTMVMFCLSIYNRYMLRDQLLSPLNGKNARFYKYNIDSIEGNMAYVTFRPRILNSQMVKGYFTYDTENKYVNFINFSGTNGISRFTCDVTMGSEGEKRYWPEKNEMTFQNNYFGNIYDGHCTFCQKYRVVIPDFIRPQSSYGKFDMTYLYAMSHDTTHVIVDSMEVAARRLTPLTEADQKIYDEKYTACHATAKNDSADVKDKDSIIEKVPLTKKVTKKMVQIIENTGERFFTSYDLALSKHRTIIFSPIHLNYSGWRGITLRENMDYSITSDSGRSLAIKPLIGYNFKPKQFVGRLRLEYCYLPRHLGQVSIEAGTKGLERDSITFNDRYVELSHDLELFNGFTACVGAVYWDRVPLHASEEGRKSFAPHITLTYTPCQTFRFSGNRKIIIGSRYPIICLDYERGIRGIFDGDNKYEKWEATVTQTFPLDPIHQLMWKIGGGLFTTSMKDVSFVDYRYFNNGIADYNWEDDWAGVFQLLDSKYYYDSKYYVRAHLVMQSPNIILGHLGTRFIRGERVYLNGLMTEGLVPYIEVGYGVSSKLLDISFFASHLKRDPIQTGLKFSLHPY